MNYLLDEEDVKGDGGTSADEMNFHRQDGAKQRSLIKSSSFNNYSESSLPTSAKRVTLTLRLTGYVTLTSLTNLTLCKNNILPIECHTYCKFLFVSNKLLEI